MYKVHYKNNDTGYTHDMNFAAINFDSALYRARDKMDTLNITKNSGWRLVGLYEILYEFKKQTTSFH